ncbi:MAG: ABC-type multidrug transport system fused ATPase/permease subunit [Cyclobacteriaceae bacterium]
MDREDRVKFTLLFFAILALGFLEVLGIASVLPFMELISKENAIEQSRWLTQAYEILAFDNKRSFLIFFGGLVLVVIALSSILSIITTYSQLKISWHIAHKKATSLLSLYLAKPYSYYLNQNTSDLRAYLVSEVSNLIAGVIAPLIDFISRTIVCLTIFALLLVVSPEATIRVFVLLSGVYVLIFLSRQYYLKRLGKERISLNVERYKYLEEMLEGIKTLKIFGVQDHFYLRYAKASKSFSDIMPKVKMVYATPKHILNFLAFGGIIGFTLYAYINEGNITNLIPKLTLYAVAGYKLLPALQSAFSSISMVRHNLPSLDILYQDLIESKKRSGIIHSTKMRMAFDHNIQLEGIYFNYKNSQNDVLKDLNLEIKKGRTVAFVGATGSGKTTLIDIIAGLLVPEKGDFSVDSKKVDLNNVEQWQNQIAYVPQEVFLYDTTLRANIAFGVENNEVNEERLEKVLKMAEIHSFINTELPDGLDTTIGERGVRLSGGQRQRIGLARALYKDPSVLILDEATSSLDNITERDVMLSIDSLPQSLTVIIIAHRLTTVKKADAIYIMEGGQIVQSGTYTELLENNTLFKQLVDLT